MRSSGWPQQFKDLPADTRSTLIGLLRSGASEAYNALMAPRGSRREALNALRRLRDAILGRQEEDEGPVDDPMNMPPAPKPKLSDADIAVVEAWIHAGAVMPKQSSSTPAGMR